MQANHTRTAQARAALKHYLKVAKRTPDTMKTDITDLITDLLHLAHAEGVDWGMIQYNANEHFVAETSERERAANGHGRSIKNPLPAPKPNTSADGRTKKYVRLRELQAIPHYDEWQKLQIAYNIGFEHAYTPDALYNANGQQIREVTQAELDWTY